MRLTVAFTKALSDQTGGQPKVFRRDYLREGHLPVIDQGAAPVAGYTNDEGAAYKGPLPVLLFGDHTRLIKYVDFPFALGADGVKVLQPAPWYEPKFLYYYLLTQNITGRGYSRHFNFLKQVSFPFLPRSEQRRIVEILDQADRLRRLRAEADAKADRILPALFIKMFGDLETNPQGYDAVRFGSIADVQGGLQLTTKRAGNPLDMAYLRVANVHRGRLDLTEIKTLPITEQELSRTRLLSGDILVVEGHGNPREIGRCAIWDGSVDPCVHQNHLIRVRAANDRATPEFLSAYLNSTSGRQQLLRAGKTTSGLNTISVSNVMRVEILMPPLGLQRDFSARVRSQAMIQRAKRQAACTLERLWVVLLDRGLSGTLTAAWREAHMTELLQEMEHQAKDIQEVQMPGTEVG